MAKKLKKVSVRQHSRKTSTGITNVREHLRSKPKKNGYCDIERNFTEDLDGKKKTKLEKQEIKYAKALAKHKKKKVSDILKEANEWADEEGTGLSFALAVMSHQVGFAYYLPDLPKRRDGIDGKQFTLVDPLANPIERRRLGLSLSVKDKKYLDVWDNPNTTMEDWYKFFDVRDGIDGKRKDKKKILIEELQKSFGIERDEAEIFYYSMKKNVKKEKKMEKSHRMKR